MDKKHRPTIGVLCGYQIYGNLTDSPTIEGSSISDYLLRVHQGILAAGQDLDCNMLVGCGLGSLPQPDHPFPAWFNWADDSTFVPVGPWNTDGLIVITPVISEPRQRLLQELREANFPIVACGTGMPAPAVVADDAAGIRDAVFHLYRHGHRQIAYIAGYEHVAGHSAIRQAAYRSAIQELGLELQPELIVYGYHTIQGGREAMRRLLEAGREFSAIVTSDYSSAMGALEILQKAGRRVPEDVALIGYDDYLDAQARVPPVTTIHMQLCDMGYQAVRLLLEYIQGRVSAPVTHSIAGQLVLRRSCGCLPEDIQPGSARTITEAEIVRQMSDAALRGAYHLRLDETQAWFTGLVQAFQSSLRGNNEREFAEALAGLMETIAGREDDAYILQAAVGVLRRNLQTVMTRPEVAGAGNLAELMLDQASLRISEYARGQAARNQVHRVNVSDALGAMTSRLLTTMDEKEIPLILGEHLPRVGIRKAAVAILQGEEDDPAAWSTFLQAEPGQDPAVTGFPTRQFPPPGLYAPETSYRSILLPLIRQNEQIGYIAFDTDDLEPLASIAQHISAALSSARLYQDAQAGRQMAESANRLKTRFLSTVSHELRTPLNLIVGLSELLLREQRQGKSPTPQDLERIYASSRHLGFLIRDVLDLTSSEIGKLRLTLEPLNMQDVLAETSAIGEQMAAEKGLAWSATLPDEDVRVLGDRARLQQVLLNLLSNAVKFTSKGSIELAARVEAGRMVISVTDTGLGIPAGERDSIFDEFHQSERTASRGFGGMGLGLAISKHIVRLHGGEIGVLSTGEEGQGTTIFFSLPKLEQSTLAGPSLAHADVLLLTDQASRAASLRSHLAGQGYDAAVFPYRQEADWLSQIKADPPSAVLLDRHLAEEHGWGILENLRRHPDLQTIPVLFYNLPEGDKNGAVLEFDLQSKPLSSESLQAILAQAPQTILLVDDDQSILDLHTRMIQSHLPGCRTINAHHGREALEILASLRPDLILLDLMMPELDGFGVLRELQASESLRDIPVVVLTAKVLTGQDMDKLSSGVASILEKGVFTNEETMARITDALEHNIRASSSQRLVRKAMAYIHEHYAETLNREMIAGHLAVSENYLTNCFQKEIGVSPLAYANRYRIRQARDLLAESDRSITEIAMTVGFADLAHFSRVFHKEMGMSPLAYRRGASKA